MIMKYTFRGLRFDSGKYTQAVRKQAEIAFRESLRAWLREVISNVPVVTGQAQGSVYYAQNATRGFLASYLRVAVKIGGEPQPDKNPETGSKFGRYSLTFRHNRIDFFYGNFLDYYAGSEAGREFAEYPKGKHSAPTPWHSIEKANTVLSAELYEQISKRLPKVSTFTSRDIIKNA